MVRADPDPEKRNLYGNSRSPACREFFNGLPPTEWSVANLSSCVDASRNASGFFGFGMSNAVEFRRVSGLMLRLIPNCGNRDLFDGAERACPARSGTTPDAPHRASSRSSPRIGAKVRGMAGRMGSYHRRLVLRRGPLLIVRRSGPIRLCALEALRANLVFPIPSFSTVRP